MKNNERREDFILEQLTGQEPNVMYIKSQGTRVYSNGWQIYLRCIRERIQLCDPCNNTINKTFRKAKVFTLNTTQVEHGVSLISRERDNATIFIRSIYDTSQIYLCNECSQTIHAALQTSKTWILGNKEYEPLVELSQYNTDDIDDKAWGLKTR